MPTQGPSQPVEAIVKINKPAVPPKQTTKSAKVVKRKHASHEDVLDLQVKVLKGQLEEQKLNKLKLQLQIDILKRLAQACSHVRGLLIALSNARSICTDDKDDMSCTSLPCQWKVPRSTVKPQPLKSLKQSKPKLVKSNESSTDVNLPPPQTNFDPRHTDDRVSDLSSTLRSLRDLKDVFRTTGMSLLWHIPDHVPNAYQEVELTTAI